MTRSKKILSATLLSSLALAACGGGGGALGAAANQFGQVFAAAFNTPANGTPNAVLNPNDIVFRGVAGPDLTADPISL